MAFQDCEQHLLHGDSIIHFVTPFSKYEYTSSILCPNAYAIRVVGRMIGLSMQFLKDIWVLQVNISLNNLEAHLF